jgi:hypothetical protein
VQCVLCACMMMHVWTAVRRQPGHGRTSTLSLPHATIASKCFPLTEFILVAAGENLQACTLLSSLTIHIQEKQYHGCLYVYIQSARPTSIPLPHCLLLKYFGDVMLATCLSNFDSVNLNTCTYAPSPGNVILFELTVHLRTAV